MSDVDVHQNMEMTNVTWRGGESTDDAMLSNLPSELQELLASTGGFIVHHGAIHFRGCTFEPKWNSIRDIYWGKQSLSMKYPELDVDDIPFAQDQVGDFYIWRNSEIFHLDAETGDISKFEHSLDEFLRNIEKDIEKYLNVSLDRRLEPGRLLHAYPPFCTVEAADGVSFKDVPVDELIDFHADFARQIRKIPEGGQVSIKITP